MSILGRLGIERGMDIDRIAAYFSIAVFIVYLSTMSISLDDEDSVHFALGLTNYNITLLQPHTPGFPVYILMGKSFNAILMNGLLSLTILSALFGALSVFIFYLLAREMLDKETALAASVLTAFTPMFWLTSLKALSDIVGLGFALLTLLLLYDYIRHGGRFYLYAGALLGGISTGIRLHTFFIVLPVLAYCLFFHRKGISTGFVALALFFVAIIAWVVPVVLLTGVGEYAHAAIVQVDFISRNPQLSAVGAAMTQPYIAARVEAFSYNFLVGGYSIDAKNLSASDVLLILLIAIILLLGAKKVRKIRDKRALFLLLSVAFYIPLIFFTLPPAHSRYMLILVPYISLIFASIIMGMNASDRIKYGFILALLVLLLISAVPLAVEIRTIPAAPVQLAEYVKQNYGNDTIFMAQGYLHQYFEYYRVGIPKASLLDCEKIYTMFSSNKNATVISNLVPTACRGIKYRRVAGFYRNPEVHEKYNLLNLYQIAPVSGLFPG